MDRLFLDANVLFSAAYRPNAGLRTFWKLKNVVLCSSRYALEEARINLSTQSQRRRLEKLGRSLHFFEAAAAKNPSGRLFAGKGSSDSAGSHGSKSNAFNHW